MILALLLDAMSDPSCAILLCRAAVILLQTVADFPMSSNVAAHLKVLDVLLSSQSSSKPSGASRAMLQHLLRNEYYQLLGRAISRIVSIFLSFSELMPSLTFAHA